MAALIKPVDTVMPLFLSVSAKGPSPQYFFNFSMAAPHPDTLVI